MRRAVNSSASVGNTKILRLLLTSEPITTLTLTYWMCTEGTSQGTLSVGYMTGDDYENDFVAIKDIPASSATQHSGNGLQDNRGIYDTVQFDTVPANAMYVAFRWYHNATFYSVALDNIELTSSVSCPAPVLLGTSNTYESIDISWLAAADTFDVAITSGTWTDNITPLATVTSRAYSFTGLTPATRYVVGVRQHCTDGVNSIWATAVVVTDSLGCVAPENFNVSNITNATAQFDWTTIGEETNWNIHIWNSASLDSLYLCTTHPVTLGGLTAGVTYNASIQPLCGTSLIPGEWSDTLTFTTATCPDVTDAAASDVTASSVTLNWAADPTAQGWTIEYGYAGFIQGQGTQVDVTTNSYVVNGLEEETEYDFHIKAICGTDWTSEHWVNVSATTLHNEVTCNAPTSVTVNAAATTATVSWTAGEGNNSFEVEYGVRGFSHGSGSIVEAQNTTVDINVLESNTQYDVYVRGLCDQSTYSNWSNVATFTTQNVGINDVSDAVCTIYPNPASSSATITVTGVNGKVRITVVDMNGRTVASETLECSSDCAKTMDVDHLAQGAYFVRITGDDVNMVKKLVVR